MITLCFLLHGLFHSGQGVSAVESEEFNGVITSMAGKGTVGLWDNEGNLLYGHNLDKKAIPASILKILTAATFLYCHSDSFRFQTDFFLDTQGNLYVKGSGDPFLVSEEADMVSAKLTTFLPKQIKNLYLDDSFFSPSLQIPGVGSSTNPYDAVNSALSVNFNTIHVTVDKNGTVSSAEPQTPLTPFAIKKALEYGKTGTFRLPLRKREDALIYFGELLQAFLRKHECVSTGKVEIKKVPAELHPFYTHCSSKSIGDVISSMFEFSNNVIANQLFLCSGATLYGPPATVTKGRAATKKFIESKLKIDAPFISEGSGISRQTLVTASFFHHLLEYFQTYHFLLQFKNDIWSKTGTLRDVETLAGYYQSSNKTDRLNHFVIMLPGRNNQREKIIMKLKENFP